MPFQVLLLPHHRYGGSPHCSENCTDEVLAHRRTIYYLEHCSQFSGVPECHRDERPRYLGNVQLEVHGLAAMLNTAVYVYTPERHNWVRFSPEVVDARLVNSITDKGLYIQNLDEQHFNVVLSTQPPNAAHGVVREGIVQGN